MTFLYSQVNRNKWKILEIKKKRNNKKMNPNFIEVNEITDIFGYIKSIDWNDQWLYALIGFHVFTTLLTLGTRKYGSFQIVIFIALLVLVYCSESINEYAAEHWKLFSKQQYFDSKGFFISIMFSMPILLNCMLLIGTWLYQSFELMSSLKTMQLKKSLEQRKRAEMKEARSKGVEETENMAQTEDVQQMEDASTETNDVNVESVGTETDDIGMDDTDKKTK